MLKSVTFTLLFFVFVGSYAVTRVKSLLFDRAGIIGSARRGRRRQGIPRPRPIL